MKDKEYIGDGVYARFDGYGIELTTENGVLTTNTIYLEPCVYACLLDFWKSFAEPKSHEVPL